jgi:pimeloyl-ACP methyl ester carboxylesterase
MTTAWPDGFVTLGDVKFHFYRTGGNKPSIILSHGFTDSGLYWASFVERFEQDYDILFYDAWGHGKSDGPTAPGLPPRDGGADLLGLINALALQHPIGIGHSLGAVAVASAASRDTNPFRAVILEDPPLANTPSITEDEGTPNAWREQVAMLQTLPKDQVLAIGHQQHPKWSDRDVECWVQDKYEFRIEMFALKSNHFPRWQDIMAPIRVPLLVVHGEANEGSMVTPEVAAELKQLVPQATIVEIVGAGHNVRRDRFDSYVETIAAWLKRLDSK